VAVDEAVLLLALAGGPEAVVLAGRGLADPAGHAQPADVVEGARQAIHAGSSTGPGDSRRLRARALA
jgi:hypothetical protein